MNSTTKTIVVVAIVVILVALFFGMRSNSTDVTMKNDQVMESGTTTDSISGMSGAKNTNGTKGTAGTAANPTAEISNEALMGLINSAKMRVPQTAVDVTLAGGSANFTDSAVKGRVMIGKILGRVPTDAGHDVFVEMTISTEKSAIVNHYVALFRNVGQGVQYTSSALIGDRMPLVSVTAAPDTSVDANAPKLFMSSSLGYKLTLAYMARQNGEPLTANPSVLKNMALKVKNHIVSK